MTTHMIAFFVVVVCLVGCSQQNQQLSQTSQEQLAMLSEWHYTDALDIDSLVDATGNELIRQLKKGRIDLRDGPDNIDQTASPDSLIWVYNFSYFSGGTAGTIYNPVIQWRKKDGSFGARGIYPHAQANFFGLETEFYKIYRLPSPDKALYLLMGFNRGNTFLLVHYALVIEIKNDSLVLDYPAFFEKHAVLSCIDNIHDGEDFVEFDFSPATNTLSIIDLCADDEIGPAVDPYNLARKPIDTRTVVFAFEKDRFVMKEN